MTPRPSPSIRELSADLEEIAREELGEDPKRRLEDIKHIQNWLTRQPHLNVNTDDQWILTFLRGCKFSLERTKEKIDSYYTMRTLLPEFYSNRDPMLPEMQKILKMGVCFPLPKPDKYGRQIFFLRPGCMRPEDFKLECLFKLHYMNMDVTLWENDRAIIAGDVSVIDLKGVTMAHAVQVQPALLKKAMTAYQDGYPVRPQSFNYINTPPGVDTVIRLIKSFLSEKLRNRLYVHGDSLEAMYERVPRECLPNELGGTAGNIADLASAWKTKVESYRDRLLKDESRRSDEKKRPGRPKTKEGLFGEEGSFRSLDVD